MKKKYIGRKLQSNMISYIGTTSLKKIDSMLSIETSRLENYVFQYLIGNENIEKTITYNKNSYPFLYKMVNDNKEFIKIARSNISEKIAEIKTPNTEFNRAYKSLFSIINQKQITVDVKVNTRKEILKLIKEINKNTKLTNVYICKNIDIKPTNLTKYLKHNDLNSISLNKASSLLVFLRKKINNFNHISDL